VIFGKEYTEYWNAAVSKSIDGTIIAGVREALHLLDYLNVEKNRRALDLGCSVGRMYEVISLYSELVHGVDPDKFAVEKASLYPYESVIQGTAERIDFGDNLFDLVFCWAVFDVVDHLKGFTEINRVLKRGGQLIITGKNDYYFEDDKLAHLAESNAYLKRFPNRFTNLKSVLSNFRELGFELDKLIIFPRRGDFGLLKFVDQGNQILDSYQAYEYLIYCHKIDQTNMASLNDVNLESPFSQTAINKAAQLKFSTPELFFESTKIA